MILSTQQKRKRTRSLRHWDLGTCGIAVLPSARSCSEIITEGRQKKKSCLTKMKIFTVKDYFLISVPAIQSDFLNVDITIICLVLQADEGQNRIKSSESLFMECKKSSHINTTNTYMKKQIITVNIGRCMHLTRWIGKSKALMCK